MDISRVRYFCTVAKTGSVRRASELLRLSPAALSKAIRLLEDELGLELTVRSGRNIELTDAGRRVAKRGELLLSDIERFRLELEQEAIAPKEIRLATFEVFSTYFLAALKHLDWGDTPITLHDLVPGELERALIDRHADIGVTYLPIPSAELDFLKVTTIEMGVYTARGAFPGVKQRDLPFVVPVMPITGTPSRIRGLDGWPDDAHPRKILYQVTLLESALELCRQGRCAGYFPSFVIQAHNAQVRPEYQLARRPATEPERIATTDVYIVKRKSDVENARVKQLARAIRMVCSPRKN